MIIFIMIIRHHDHLHHRDHHRHRDHHHHIVIAIIVVIIVSLITFPILNLLNLKANFQLILRQDRSKAAQCSWQRMKVLSKIFCQFSRLKILHEYLHTVKYEMNMFTV